MKSPRSGGFAHLVLLAGIAAVVVGGGFAATSGDIAYNSQSLLAAAVSTFNTTPRIEITRDGGSPTGYIWPVENALIGSFAVISKNITGTSHITNISTSIAVDTSLSALKRARFAMQYSYCASPNGGNCKTINLPVASATLSGSTYIIAAKNVRLPVTGSTSYGYGRLDVRMYPYYALAFSPANATPTQVRAAVVGQVTAVGASTGVSYPVNTTLAYGNWLKVSRRYGYGYGYFDLTNDGKLSSLDSTLLSRVIHGVIGCPIFKYCDINGDSRVNALDATKLASLYPPSPTKGVSLTVEPVSVRQDLSDPGPLANDDTGTFTVKYKVTAVGGDVYISPSANVTLSGVTAGKTSAGVERAGTPVTNGVSVVLVNVTDTDATPRGNYAINEGASETFEVTTAVKLPQAGVAGLYRTVLRGISWGTSDVASMPNTYVIPSTAAGFKTSYLSLN